ncbi:MAG: type II secretion system minor pseudopilin GspJ [Bacterioplanes sp.]|nr:type II secretion system minor pseudopilin GspJ [Bacterioplanes sp.]
MINVRGFTLLEVLIAVAITATIGVGATQLLRGVIDAKQATDMRSHQLASLQRFNAIVSRDAQQWIDRSVRDNFGEPLPALMLDQGDYAIEWTRAGWRNSPVGNTLRAELQRVAYRTESIESDVCEPARQQLQTWGVESAPYDCLVRYYWTVLDRASDSQPKSQVLLNQVDRFELEVLIEQGAADNLTQDWFSAWPGLTEGGNSKALRWRFEIPSIGEVERIWLLAAGSAL